MAPLTRFGSFRIVRGVNKSGLLLAFGFWGEWFGELFKRRNMTGNKMKIPKTNERFKSSGLWVYLLRCFIVQIDHCELLIGKRLCANVR